MPSVNTNVMIYFTTIIYFSSKVLPIPQCCHNSGQLTGTLLHPWLLCDSHPYPLALLRGVLCSEAGRNMKAGSEKNSPECFPLQEKLCIGEYCKHHAFQSAGQYNRCNNKVLYCSDNARTILRMRGKRLNVRRRYLAFLTDSHTQAHTHTHLGAMQSV